MLMAAVCYCFNYTDDAIRTDVLQHHGRSTILEKISAAKKTGVCQCEIKNPNHR